MKTTVEIPDDLFRRAKAAAARQGIPLKELITDALRDRLRCAGAARLQPPPWMQAFGQLRHLHRENKRVERVIAEEFESIDEEDWR